MKNKIGLMCICLLAASLYCSTIRAQTSPVTAPDLLTKYPWIEADLLAPSSLAAQLKLAPGKLPLILNIGAVEDIKGAVHIGAVSNPVNMKRLKDKVSELPKNSPIVIYCGCCPFIKCPNIQPAFVELKRLGFSNVSLLNLPVNLQTNWIAQGYPLASN